MIDNKQIGYCGRLANQMFQYAALVGVATKNNYEYGIPFENARRAYYADKTWPMELRRNYRSPINALMRIPFEEGPYYLFRGGFPIAMNQWLFWVTYLTFFSFNK